MSILFAWLGLSDLRAAEGGEPDETGPILTALKTGDYDCLVLLSDHREGITRHYRDWLSRTVSCAVVVRPAKLRSPTHFEDIYVAANDAVIQAQHTSPGSRLTFHLSPGTPAMAAVWIVLAKARYGASLVETSREHGVGPVDIPFDLAAEFLPVTNRQADDALAQLVQGLPPATPEFASIIHRCDAMKRVIAMAQRLAQRELPVLIQGESGTGKELFARAIHASGSRRAKPFIAVNCGAIPPELVDSELFGHEKGAFTGAHAARQGHFESADGGTLFLDEIGELPLASQVRLLRVLQEREVTRLGASRPRKIDVRIIAATNRVLPQEIRQGRFREDVFHRIAVGILSLPPLRAREGDLNLLIDALLEQINQDAAIQPGYQHKKLSVGARNLMHRHPWRGNVRELHNALLRASVWAWRDEIAAADMAEVLALTGDPGDDPVLDLPLGNAFSLPQLMGDVARHYLNRAMAQSHGNKTEAARLLGLGSYQTLSNWMSRYAGKDAGTTSAL
ncbi:Fis family transcriptional regulator [Paraburkholderia hospita]|uniref:Fis family transcriptional regulator n=1 Tax=Paraburkholderia hospita TaxID=169430 RepID=A0ABN0FKJ7_9BURK|nr:sigma 54-interacting transcriptional regulator [Paraburkholderia hospita]EIM99249.1 Fis family transcriptional regulator [Paraburkholderia hospita]OUL86594.1 AAA family ATPase [Paraburkholderia hospita]